MYAIALHLPVSESPISSVVLPVTTCVVQPMTCLHGNVHSKPAIGRAGSDAAHSPAFCKHLSGHHEYVIERHTTS